LKLTIDAEGTVRTLYTEVIDLDAIGEPDITRASHVEPYHGGGWFADLSPVQGPELGPYPTRSEALAAEARWIEDNRL
jgi:hypothetical protein